MLLLDASAEISDQDAHIAGYVLESGRALVIAVNKWDGLDEYQRDRIKREIDRKLHFLRWARIHTISALKRTGLSAVMRSVSEAHAAAFAKAADAQADARAAWPPSRARCRRAPARSRPKLRYAHQGGMNPPVIVIHGNSLNHVPDSYRRYLEGSFPRRIRTGRHAAASRIPDRAQPLRDLRTLVSKARVLLYIELRGSVPIYSKHATVGSLPP